MNDIERIIHGVRKDVKRNYEVISKYSYKDYVAMKEDLGWVNKDVAEIVDFEHMSVKNQTQPKYDLPLWAQVLVHLWRQENEGLLGKKDVSKEVVKNLEKFKKAFRESQEEVDTLKKRVTYLEKELRKAERREKQRANLIEQLDAVERDSVVDVSQDEELTSSVVKHKLGKIATKHKRKVGILDKLRASIERGHVEMKSKGKKSKVKPVKASTKSSKGKTRGKATAES